MLFALTEAVFRLPKVGWLFSEGKMCYTDKNTKPCGGDGKKSENGVLTK